MSFHLIKGLNVEVITEEEQNSVKGGVSNEDVDMI